MKKYSNFIIQTLATKLNEKHDIIFEEIIVTAMFYL